MAVQCSSRMARRMGLGAAAAALALLGGCVAVPVEPYQVGDPVAYPATYGDAYYAPGYSTYPSPYYYGPPLSVGVYGWSGGRNWYRPPPPPRPGWGNPPPRPRPGWNNPPSRPRPPSAGVRPNPGGWDNPRPAPPPRGVGGGERPTPGGWDNPSSPRR